MAGKFLFGAVSDRFRKQRVMVVTSLTLLAGCLLLFTAGDGGLALAGNPAQLAAFAVIFGLGFGGSFTLIQLVAVESFGQLALGRILGVIITVVVIVAVIAVANVLLIRPLSHDQPGKRR